MQTRSLVEIKHPFPVVLALSDLLATYKVLPLATPSPTVPSPIGSSWLEMRRRQPALLARYDVHATWIGFSEATTKIDTLTHTHTCTYTLTYSQPHSHTRAHSHTLTMTLTHKHSHSRWAGHRCDPQAQGIEGGRAHRGPVQRPHVVSTQDASRRLGQQHRLR